ncbi:hypothetical protein D3C80_1842590 [compost metagenome]
MRVFIVLFLCSEKWSGRVRLCAEVSVDEGSRFFSDAFKSVPMVPLFVENYSISALLLR